MSRRIVVLPALQELKELLCATLLEETHQRALDCLHLRARHLRDLALAVDEAARDLLELEVAGDIGVDEDASELSGSDDELGNEIDGVVAVAPKVLGDGLIGAELAVELHADQGIRLGAQEGKMGNADLGQVQTGTVTTVVGVPVHVEDLLALDREQTRQDTFCQASAQHNDLLSN